jgi:hypothetical protein
MKEKHQEEARQTIITIQSNCFSSSSSSPLFVLSLLSRYVLRLLLALTGVANTARGFLSGLPYGPLLPL